MKCRICHSKKIVQVIDLGKQPLANKYPKNKFEVTKLHPLPWSVEFQMNRISFFSPRFARKSNINIKDIHIVYNNTILRASRGRVLRTTILKDY